MQLFHRTLGHYRGIPSIGKSTISRPFHRSLSIMAPKRKTAVVEMVAVDVEASTLSRRKLPRRSTQQVKEESIEPLPEIESEIKIVEKRTRARTTSKPQAKPKARPQAKTQTPDVKVEDDEAENDDEAVAVERGARRAPPVNSNLLPLPWSGRLGYVRFTMSLPHAFSTTPADCQQGLSEYISPNSQSTSIFVTDMSHSIDPRASASAPRPVTARALHEEQTRQVEAGRRLARPRVCAGPGTRQRPRHCQDAALERQVRHQVSAPEQRNVSVCEPR
jgi:hypothetical protein